MKKTINIITAFLFWPILIAYKNFNLKLYSILNFTLQIKADFQFFFLLIGPFFLISITLLNNVFYSFYLIWFLFEFLNNFICAVHPINFIIEINDLILIIPIKIYCDLKNPTTIKQMRIDNKNKAGIYRIINKLNGKFYIGSSSSLTNRLNRHYYSSKYQEKSSIKLLVSAFKKYGIENFSFEILEYCESSALADLLKREQYYLDLLKPAYNILTIAGSSKGSKWSEANKAKLSDGRRKGKNSVWLGKTHTIETKLLMTLHNKKTQTLFCYIKNNSEIKGKKPELTTKNLKFLIKFNSMREASKYFKIPVSSIHYAVKNGNFYKSTYFFSTVELDLK